MTSVLIVCTANMCRSPMAEVLLRDAAKRRGLAWEVSSAGTAAAFGSPPATNAVPAMAELGFDLSDHRSRPVRAEYLTESTIVLAMARRHIDDIARDFGRHGHLFLFNEMVGQKKDVADPIGGPVDDFLVCARGLQATIESGMEWLQQKTATA